MPGVARNLCHVVVHVSSVPISVLAVFPLSLGRVGSTTDPGAGYAHKSQEFVHMDRAMELVAAYTKPIGAESQAPLLVVVPGTYT